MEMSSPFLPKKNSVLLAPLAGVSDVPFRLACQQGGADLSYVEMISATALIYRNARTLSMLARHQDETQLGVQITGRNSEEVAQAVDILNDFPFETVDINMGCPVKKVVSTGGGSAILKDVTRVYETVRAAKAATSRPVSVKIRLGWDRDSLNYLDVADAAQQGGASWLTVHGRTRNDRYVVPVDLRAIQEIKQRLQIPVFGNGNIFSQKDALYMQDKTAVDGVMVSRGALGNPWVFSEIKTGCKEVTVEQWLALVSQHMKWQQTAYPQERVSVLCMRKHLLWYLKGWPYAASAKDQINSAETFDALYRILDTFVAALSERQVTRRFLHQDDRPFDERFRWREVS